MFSDGPERLLVFRMGAERFALTLAAVDEVVDAPAIQPLPDASEGALGLAAIHDELVAIFDPSPILRVKAQALRAVLLFQRGGRRIGLAIDDVYDAISVEKDELRSVPGSESSDGSLLGVVRRGTDLIGVLDAEALLDATTAVSDGGRT